MISTLLLATLAFAAPAEPGGQPTAASTSAPVWTGPDPGVEADDVVAQYSAWAKAHKLRGSAAELACAPFAEKLELCFTKVTGGTRSYYTVADGKTVEELLAAGKGDEEAAIAPLVERWVDGFTPSYFLTTGQPRAHTALLFPDALERRLGGSCVVGVPSVGVLLAWIPGDLDFDKVMAVGVKRMYDTLPDPVSPLVYTWSGGRWIPWAEITELKPPSP